MLTHSSVFDQRCCCYCSVVKSCPTLCNPMDYITPGFPVLHYLPEWLKFLSIESMMPSNCLIFCFPLFLLSSNFPNIFSKELAFPNRWAKYWSLSFNISPSNEYSALISFRIDWFDLLGEHQGLSRVFFSTTVQKYQFFGAQPVL